MLSVLGIIPARWGSKGIPQKNIALLGNKRLIEWTIEAAADAALDYFVCTCERNIAFTVPESRRIYRPWALDLDDTPMIDVLQHAMREVARRRRSVVMAPTQSAEKIMEALTALNESRRYDAVMTLQPTTPFRSAQDITDAIEIMDRTECDSVISFVDVGSKHPARMAAIEDGGRVSWLHSRDRFARRQELPPRYLRAGSIYLTKWEVLKKGSIEGDDCRALIVPPERAINIDTPEDLAEARRMVESGNYESCRSAKTSP